jgi:spermidine/putrescine ABC transporter ATP-binding subunit
MPARIRVTDLVMRYGGITAVQGISFEVAEGELLSLLGPSGCGKTTTLRCIGGYETPTSGSIEIAGRIVDRVPIYKRDIGMVFQSYALFPHKTVGDNVGFALKMRGVGKAQRRDQIEQALALVGMNGFEGRYPRQLSGGQRQRVALARALIHRPAVLLLDEPLANLDRKLREAMRVEIKLIQEQVGVSAIFVTHDQEEALVMSDRIAVMDGGRIHQIGTPAEIYNRPATAFVARFIGDTNFLSGTVAEIENGLATVRVSDDRVVKVETIDGLGVGREIGLSIRPERIEIGTERPQEAANVVEGTIEFVNYLGSLVSYRVRAEGETSFKVLKPLLDELPPFAEGSRVAIWWTPDKGKVIV